MTRKMAFLVLLVLCLVVPQTMAAAPQFTPGAKGVGDPYFPLAGNGGYDVQSYLLNLAYNPSNDTIYGSATIIARATQYLSRFNLDFEGLNIQSLKVNGLDANWQRSKGELTVQPRYGLAYGKAFIVVVVYSGVPETIKEEGGLSGFIHTTDGAVVAGQPKSAATWFPVNDHPSDKASYTIKLTVPSDLQAISNGVLESRRTTGNWSTWTWQAREPMASYMVTVAIGNFDVRNYRANGISYWDAIDSALLEPVAVPRSGTQFAVSQLASLSYKRLTRTITVPNAGANLSFWVDRDIELNWDFMFVEAHTPGKGDWTTLPDANGHTNQEPGFACSYWQEFHPFLKHYQSVSEDGTCSPTGTTGVWWAATGESAGWEQWSVDLGAWAGKKVEVSISYASDDIVQFDGVFIDDIVVSTGAGSTSFEDDGNTFDGWKIPGPPPGSEPNPNDWIAGTVADTPEPLGENIKRSFDRQPEVITFLSDIFGPYPFSAAGGIVDNNGEMTFALETQTRPIYSKGFFRDQVSGDSVVVHELAHQWAGDNLAVAQWKHIWLNEGFATYTEWLWSEKEGNGTAQEIFDYYHNEFEDDSYLWTVKIGDPGPDNLFARAVYDRGAMTLHQLRLTVGDDDFFNIMRKWNKVRAGGNVTTDQFIQVAEQVSKKDLQNLFDTWLFTTGKPVLNNGSRGGSATSAQERPATVRLLERGTANLRK